jgi:hypothetical protein
VGDSPAPKSGEIVFLQDFFVGVLHEGKSEDDFSVSVVHPSRRPFDRSHFVPRRGVFVHAPAGVVDKNDTMQRSAATGREDMAPVVLKSGCVHRRGLGSHEKRRPGIS